MENQKIIVYKSNRLIEMQSDLSLIQLKIFTKVIIETIKDPNDEYKRFNVKDLMREFNMTETHYTTLKRATADMIKAVILKTQNGENQFALFTSVKYNSGVVDMYLHPEIKPLILDIENKYTKYFFQYIL